ncbi:MAG TPA: hypothetical protein VJC05_04025 [Candidatus Andersenbacteria bacterium]|nr:hypothetical protein [Candidatus Andersenbacteria bacterium]
MPRRVVKELILSALALLLSAALWWTIASAAATTNFQLTPIIIGVGLLWITAWAIALAFVRYLILASFIAGAMVLLVLLGGGAIGAVGAAVILAGFLPSISWRLRLELAARKRYQTMAVFAGSLRWLVMCLLIAVAGLTFSAVAGSLSTTTVLIPPTVIERIVSAAPNATEIPAAEIGTIATTIATTLNQYLTSTIHQNPLLAALTAILTLLFVSRLLVQLLVWPALTLLGLAIFLGRQAGFFSLQQEEEVTERLIL